MLETNFDNSDNPLVCKFDYSNRYLEGEIVMNLKFCFKNESEREKFAVKSNKLSQELVGQAECIKRYCHQKNGKVFIATGDFLKTIEKIYGFADKYIKIFLYNNNSDFCIYCKTEEEQNLILKAFKEQRYVINKYDISKTNHPYPFFAVLSIQLKSA